MFALNIFISDITCAVPEQIDNGFVYALSLKYGDIAIVVCNNNYALKSGDQIRNCTGNGTWSSTEAVCAGKTS